MLVLRGYGLGCGIRDRRVRFRGWGDYIDIGVYLGLGLRLGFV